MVSMMPHQPTKAQTTDTSIDSILMMTDVVFSTLNPLRAVYFVEEAYYDLVKRHSAILSV